MSRKIGAGFAQRWAELGLNELRNAAAFDNSNVVDDIRRSQNPQQEQHHYHHQVPQQDQQQDQSLEQGQER